MLAKHHIRLDASNLKLIRHPRKELKVQASEIQGKESFAKLFPKDARPDLTYVQFVSFTIGNINANDCLILPEEGLASYRSISETPVDIEHDRKEVVGFAIKSFLSNVKNTKVLTDDEAAEILDGKGMVNVGAVCGIWRINNPEIDELLQENFNENSEYFDTVKASFEYYFNDYDFFISDASSNYPNGKIVSGDPTKNEQSDAMFDALRINGGSGKWEENRLSICPKGGFIGGNALTFRPANVYSDLLAKKNGNSVELRKEIKNNTTLSVNSKEESLMDKDTKLPEDKKAPEAPPATPVTFPAPEAPKVTEATVAAISVDKEVVESLQKNLDSKIAEMKAKEEAVANLTAKVEELTKNLGEAQNLMKDLQSKHDESVEKLQKIEQARIDAEKKAKIDARLMELSKVVVITDANKAILESEAATLSDEDFAKKLDFYASISKKTDASEVTPPAKEDVKEKVEAAVTEAAQATTPVQIVTPPPPKTLAEQFKEHFGKPESFGLKLK